MRAFLRVSLAAALAWAPFVPASAQTQVAPVPAASLGALSPLGQLGGLIGGAMPGLSGTNLLAPSFTPDLQGALAPVRGPVPKGLDPAKAAALLERAQALTPAAASPAAESVAAPAAVERKESSPAKSATPKTASAAWPAAEGKPPAQARAAPSAGREEEPQGQSRPQAFEVLQAVNSVLRDFTPEDIRTMPAEKLHGLSGSIMDQLAKGRGEVDVETAAVLAEGRLARLRPKLGKAPVEKLVYDSRSDRRESRYDVDGLPEGARLVPNPREIVFRHYTTQDGLKEILSSSRLWNGILNYVQLVPMVSRKAFTELTGIFLTLPGVPGASVGVPKGEFPVYVDIRLPAGLPLLELEPGRIFLLPLPPRTRGWVKDYYSKWLMGKESASEYARMSEGLDRDGGPGPDLSVPVEVVGRGTAR